MKKYILVGLFFLLFGIFLVYAQLKCWGVWIKLPKIINPEVNNAGKCTYDNKESESDGNIVPRVLGVGLVGTVNKKRKFKLF